MSAKLLRLSAGDGGVLRLAVEEEDFPHPRRRTYRIEEADYLALGQPCAGEELDEETLALLAEAEGRAEAESRAVRILSYGACSASALVRKLRQKGYSRESSEAAVARMMQKGYLNEEEQAYRLATLAVKSKCWGRRRVLAYLASRGYPQSLSRTAIAKAEEEGDIDFAEARTRLLEKHLSPDADAAEKRALLYKYGY